MSSRHHNIHLCQENVGSDDMLTCGPWLSIYRLACLQAIYSMIIQATLACHSYVALKWQDSHFGMYFMIFAKPHSSAKVTEERPNPARIDSTLLVTALTTGIEANTIETRAARVNFMLIAIQRKFDSFLGRMGA